MSDEREKRQLMLVAMLYLELAEKVPLSETERVTTIQQHEQHTDSLRSFTLSNLDVFFAHVASAAVRLATLREMQEREKRRACLYQRCAKLPPEQAHAEALEVFLRDNIGHREMEPHMGMEALSIRGKTRRKEALDLQLIRKKILQDLSPMIILPRLRARCHRLANEAEDFA